MTLENRHERAQLYNLQLHKFSALVMPFCLFTFQNSRSNACKLNSIVLRFILNLYFVIRMLHDEWITNTALLIFILLFFLFSLVWVSFRWQLSSTLKVCDSIRVNKQKPLKIELVETFSLLTFSLRLGHLISSYSLCYSHFHFRTNESESA